MVYSEGLVCYGTVCVAVFWGKVQYGLECVVCFTTVYCALQYSKCWCGVCYCTLCCVLQYSIG